MNQNELYHYGVKGMHWGVRKSRTRDEYYVSVENPRYRRLKKAAKIGVAVGGAYATIKYRRQLGSAAKFAGRNAYRAGKTSKQFVKTYGPRAARATKKFAKTYGPKAGRAFMSGARVAGRAAKSSLNFTGRKAGAAKDKYYKGSKAEQKVNETYDSYGGKKATKLSQNLGKFSSKVGKSAYGYGKKAAKRTYEFAKENAPKAARGVKRGAKGMYRSYKTYRKGRDAVRSSFIR